MTKKSMLSKVSGKNSVISANPQKKQSEQINRQKSVFTINTAEHPTASKSPLNKAKNVANQGSESLNINDCNNADLTLNIDFKKFEEELDLNEKMQARRTARMEKRHAVARKSIMVILILGCVYLIFLIYGAINTQYIYAESGAVVAQRMTVEKIRNLNEFNNIAKEYRQARSLYESVLTLDYRVAAGEEDPLLVAPEYEKLLETVEKLVIQIQGDEIEAEYTQINTMLQEWVGTDVAVYCQRMSQAISQNNAEYANQAIQYRQVIYDTFSVITENISKIGDEIEGADISDIKKWSPESYVQENIGAIE